MKFLRIFGFAAVVAVLVMLAVACTASATILTSPSGTEYKSTIKAELKEGESILKSSFIGEVKCKKSTLEGKVETSGAELTASGKLSTLDFTECNSTVTVLKSGSLEIHGTSEGNGTVTSTGTEATVEIVGIHCIFTTSNTNLGTLTGGTPAVFQAKSAAIPRTGGKSGAFCGSSASWSATYKLVTPSSLFADGSGGGGKTSTTTTTSLSGESKSGEEITVNEGSKVKDTATLSGTNVGKATGTVKYKVYADKECKEVVTSAGEVTVTSGSVPASEEKKLEAGRVYYWQAEYSGDSSNEASKSTCGKEVLTVKAATSLATSLSGESKSGEEITVNEGSKVKDTATISGTRSSTATGKVKFKAYKDKECKELASEAGEGSLSESKANSEEKALEAGAVYYWQAEYAGDSLHQASTSTCGKEVLTVKAATSLSTLLAGENPGGEEPFEGEEITIGKGSGVVDSATLSGTRSSTATGEVSFDVYADGECKELVDEAGEAELEEGSAAPSEEVELEEGTYYWRATYEGDSLHQASVSPCTEVVHVIAGTSLATSLSGEGEEGDSIEVSEEALVTDRATLSGAAAAEATGSVEYFVYSDSECKELVVEAGEVSVAGEVAPASNGITLESGIYYWQAVYSGDSLNQASTSECGSEVEIVLPPLTTTLTGGKESAGHIKVTEGTPVHDEAVLHGKHASEATGTIEYLVYGDEECENLVAEAGEVEVAGASAPPSGAVELEAPGMYYWQAVYSGDEQNPPATSPCGTEISIVRVPTYLTTSLSGGGKEGAEISVEEGTAVSDQATLSGAAAATATGSVTYTVYRDSECTEVAAPESASYVEEGGAEPSGEVTLPPGTYYWLAEYSGDDFNEESISACGSEKEVVTTPITTTLSGGEQSGAEIQVTEGTSVTGKATLHGKYASEATGSVSYLVYGDSDCEELVAEGGEFEFKEGKVPSSNSVVFEEPGLYYWQAEYSGDEENPPATSACGLTEVQVVPPNWQYAALGDSYSSGEGVKRTGGTYYDKTEVGWVPWVHGKNICHRSPNAWPARIAANALGGAGAIAAPTIYEWSSRFIFRACSGAKTENVWNGTLNSGQYDEIEEPGGAWHKTPAQVNWLRGAVLANPRIAAVSLTIGGNDAGFPRIVKKCYTSIRITVSYLREYNPVPCQEEIEQQELTGFPVIENNIPAILEKIAEYAPNARIRVFLYPHVLNLMRLEIPITKKGNLIIDNAIRRKRGLTAARTLDVYITRLNEAVANGVTKAVAASPGLKGVVKTVSATADALGSTTGGPFGNHRLGDPAPWLNGLLPDYHYEESFHPKVCGHQAIAVLARPELTPGAPALIPCP